MNEHELCNALISEVSELGFRVFEEYENWDIVLNRGNILIGVQAKLKLNLKVIAQCLRSGGVHFKVILVNNYNLKPKDDLLLICSNLKIIVLNRNDYGIQFINGDYHNWRWLLRFRYKPKKLLSIPDFEYNTPSGVKSPRKVTQRNINLVKLELYALQRGGYISLADARQFGFNRVPRIYYEYEHKIKMWRLKPPFWRASKDYPHIYQGLTQ